MSDEQNGAPIEEPNGDPDPAPNGEPSGWEKEKADLIKNHNAANKRARELSNKVKALEAQLSETHKKEPPENDPVKMREAFTKRESDLAKEIESLKAERDNGLKHSAFMKFAGGLFVDKSVDKVWKLIEGELDVEVIDGRRTVTVKDSHLSLEDYLKNFADENDYFARNKRKGGTGAEGGNPESKSESGMTHERFAKMSTSEQQAWALKNPQAMRKLLSS